MERVYLPANVVARLSEHSFSIFLFVIHTSIQWVVGAFGIKLRSADRASHDHPLPILWTLHSIGFLMAGGNNRNPGTHEFIMMMISLEEIHSTSKLSQCQRQAMTIIRTQYSCLFSVLFAQTFDKHALP